MSRGSQKGGEPLVPVAPRGAKPREYIQVQTTADSKVAAEGVAALLIDQQLAACVQVVGPVVSHYRWQGKVKVDQEWLCLAKTTRVEYERVEAAIRAAHSYETPEIIATPIVAGSADYLAWIDENVG